MALLDVRRLSVEFLTGRGRLRAVDDVSFAIGEGEILGLVGESGSGKTVACRAMLGLLPPGGRRRLSGEAAFEGRDLMAMNEEQLRAVHGARIGMIFQNPSSHLDPLMTVGRQVAEPLIYHEGLSRRESRARAVELLRQVGIPDPARAAETYPHQLSGGMRQRVMIAAAVACRPRLLVADEPTTALDVTVQTQILRLLLDLRDRTGLAIILITHDLAVIASTCDSVAVMYAGRIMEQGPKPELIARARHPYTIGLIRSQPSRAVPGRELPSIEGQLPGADDLPAGCRFHPRCAFAEERCRRSPVALEPVGREHVAACLRWRELEQAA
jgi:peptide/nickel transport system ATP-binding protein